MDGDAREVPGASPRRFEGNFTQQEAICERGQEAALRVLRSGRLHRYNAIQGEDSEAALLEREFAAYLGVAYCLACASGGAAMQIALRAAGVSHGDAVLTNGFTLAPVPGAIEAVGGRSVLVEITNDLVIDLDELERRQKKSAASVLLLSNMRGHIADMGKLTRLCTELGLTLIEDCAHTMGASWAGQQSGTFGLAGCFSTQTYKHMNSGEGGFLVADDADFMAKAIILSGSYKFYDKHGAAPDPEIGDRHFPDMPNCSMRMDNLRAAILRPQLAALDQNCQRWNTRYAIIAEALDSSGSFALPSSPADASRVGSSIQFRLRVATPKRNSAFIEAAAGFGIDLKWFGASSPVAYTSTHQSWRYSGDHNLPATDAILADLLDMRIPLTFSIDDCRQIGRILQYCARQTAALGTTA